MKTHKTAEEIYEEHIGINSEMGYKITPKENVIKAMEEYAEQIHEITCNLFMKPIQELKPLEDLWREENSPNKYIIPDATRFYKWIREKILTQNK